MCLYKIFYYGNEFFDIGYGFSLKSREYHEIAIMVVFKNMKVQQYFKGNKHVYCHQET